MRACGVQFLRTVHKTDRAPNILNDSCPRLASDLSFSTYMHYTKNNSGYCRCHDKLMQTLGVTQTYGAEPGLLGVWGGCGGCGDNIDGIIVSGG